ncbi:MAG TPA: NEW3 domain-containing protein, partial [Umezawaea sp.]|nr:NEW3 domain-containing protein [Umezawaea sp.]
LAYQVGTSPSAWGTQAGSEPPSINKAQADGREHVDASVRPASAILPTKGSAQTLTLSLDVLGQSPGTLSVPLKAVVPPGWGSTLQRAPLLIESKRLPVQKTVTLPITVPANAAPGTYQVKVTAGAVTKIATVEIRAAGSCATVVGGQCAVDLGRERNHDGAATVSQSSQGDFDGGGWSYDGDLLPPAGTVAWDGVTYSTPDPTGTANNFVETRGQAVLLPQGNYSAIKVVSASHNGPVTGAVTLRYADGTSTQVSVTVGDWAGSTPPGSTVVLDMPHRIKAGQGVDGPPVRLFGQSLPVDPAKVLQSVTLPDDPRVEVYAVTLV